MDQFNTALLIVLGSLVAACTAPQYTSIQQQDSANISFTSMSDNFPDLELHLRGKTYSIRPDVVDIANSGSANKKVFTVPANEKILLSYETSELTDTLAMPVMQNFVSANTGTIPGTGQTTPTVGHQIDFEDQARINLCSTQFVFTAEKNKNYQAFVEQSDGIVCRVYVKQVISSRDGAHDTYKSLKPAS